MSIDERASVKINIRCPHCGHLPVPRRGLTPTQAHMLSAIERLSKLEGFAPSYEELAHATGLKSKSAVCQIIRRLKHRGHVTFQPSHARSLKVVAP